MEKKKVNFKPRAGYILVTSNLVKKDHSLILGKTAPEIKEVQQVVAVGDSTDVIVGDWVFLNLQNFVQTVKKQSTIRAGIGGQDMITEQIVIPFFSVPGDETVYIKINAREIEGIIPNYEALPEYVKSFVTLNDFTREQEAMLDASSKAMAEHTREVVSNSKEIESKGPMVITDSSRIKMYK